MCANKTDILNGTSQIIGSKKWKNAKYQQGCVSPLFNAIGQEWGMQIYPNGFRREGTTDLIIGCRSIESDEEIELNVCHYIGIDALNHCQINFDGNTVNKDQHYI
eukprot:126948_1